MKNQPAKTLHSVISNLFTVLPTIRGPYNMSIGVSDELTIREESQHIQDYLKNDDYRDFEIKFYHCLAYKTSVKEIILRFFGTIKTAESIFIGEFNDQHQLTVYQCTKPRNGFGEKLVVQPIVIQLVVTMNQGDDDNKKHLGGQEIQPPSPSESANKSD